MIRFGLLALGALLTTGSALAAPEQPPTVAQWIVMTPQQRMALREQTRSWSPADRSAFWARFDDEMKAMTPTERQTLRDQATVAMRALASSPPPTPAPMAPLPKAIALPPPGDLTGQPD
ncbi:MAG: hypothetical protein JWO51_256 [Rhodospirillales bacterium]|nr:hypothetical protein [Rhodospirillales bacterium]